MFESPSTATIGGSPMTSGATVVVVATDAGADGLGCAPACEPGESLDEQADAESPTTSARRDQPRADHADAVAGAITSASNERRKSTHRVVERVRRLDHQAVRRAACTSNEARLGIELGELLGVADGRERVLGAGDHERGHADRRRARGAARRSRRGSRRTWATNGSGGAWSRMRASRLSQMPNRRCSRGPDEPPQRLVGRARPSRRSSTASAHSCEQLAAPRRGGGTRCRPARASGRGRGGARR